VKRLLHRSRPEIREGQRRLLLPFAGGELDPAVLGVALRIARAEDAVLVPAYLLAAPLELPPDAPLNDQVGKAMPLLEAVEMRALKEGVPVDARIEWGRTPIHALQRLWDIETFDQIVVPAPTPGQRGFSPKELGWMLTRAPAEILVLRPNPGGEPHSETSS
jgi:hypothetical protein